MTPASGSINPTGTVAFYDGATQIGTTQTLTNGPGNTATASINISTLPVGTQDITAQYVAASGSGFINSGSSMNLTTGTNPLAYTITGINTNSVLTANLPSPQPLFTSITLHRHHHAGERQRFSNRHRRVLRWLHPDRQHADRRRRHRQLGHRQHHHQHARARLARITAEYFPTGDFGGSTSAPLVETIIPSLSTPIISEFLASNQGGLLDAAGESSDWIEIYNPTSTPIDLL